LVVGHPKLHREREREREKEKESCTWTTHSLEFESLQAPLSSSCKLPFLFASLSTAFAETKKQKSSYKIRPIIIIIIT
jgi:hypothetical protein